MNAAELSRISIVIPSLNPDEKLKKTVDSLLDMGFTDIILVNDGSREDSLAYFPKPNEHVTLLTHEVNRGKGAGLKTAFAYIMRSRPNSLGAVTVDGDGQHAAKDVLSLAETMIAEKDAIILGCRDFSLAHVPAKSRYGNRITSFVFKVFCGLHISDTQTGLRAIPSMYYEAMTEVAGERFEYETNMLLEMKARNIRYREVKIDTVYIEDNKSSHFRPFVDSVRIYSLILKFAACSLFTFTLDVILVYTFLSICAYGFKVNLETGNEALIVTACAKGGARIVSSIVNFCINRKRVFHSKEKFAVTLGKYYAVAFPLLIVSSAATLVFKLIFSAALPILITIIGAAVDILLFVVSFRLQQTFVFGRRKEHES